MKPLLILFTNTYPYGTGEDFLDSELPIIAKYFQTITIQPITAGRHSSLREIPANANVRSPILPKSRVRKFFVGIRDLFRHDDLQKEFFSCRVFSSRVRFYNYLLAVAIKTYWNKKKFDVTDATVYFYWGLGAAYIVSTIKVESNMVVVRLHGGDLYEELSDGYHPLKKNIFERADRICPVSEYGKEYLLAKYPQFEPKILVSRLGTRNLGLGLFRPVPEQMVLVSCGNLIPLKRISLLAECLSCQTKNIIWHHFGDGPEMATIKTLVSKHSNNIKTVLHGRQPNTAILSFYIKNHVDVFVSVSETEGVPVSIMEAMSFGLPVVATDVGGTAEILYKEGSVLLQKEFMCKDLSKALDIVSDISCNFDVRDQIRSHWAQIASAKINYKIFAMDVLSHT